MEENDQARVQNLASMVGVDWSQLWNFLQVFQPVAREAVISILEQLGWLPVAAQEGVKVPMAKGTDPAQVSAVAQAGIDPNFLQNLLQRIGPILAQIILALLAKPTLMRNTSGSVSSSSTRPLTSGTINQPHGQKRPEDKTPTEEENAPQ